LFFISKIITTFARNSVKQIFEIMKELMKHLPAIKNFMEERTKTLQELSDTMVRNFLTEAYKLPFLFPVRIIVSEEKFVNFLFDMRKELFEGKKIEITSPTTAPEVIKETVPSDTLPETTKQEETSSSTPKTTKAKKVSKVSESVVENTENQATLKSAKNTKASKTSKSKKENMIA